MADLSVSAKFTGVPKSTGNTVNMGDFPPMYQFTLGDDFMYLTKAEALAWAKALIAPFEDDLKERTHDQEDSSEDPQDDQRDADSAPA